MKNRSLVENLKDFEKKRKTRENFKGLNLNVIISTDIIVKIQINLAEKHNKPCSDNSDIVFDDSSFSNECFVVSDVSSLLILTEKNDINLRISTIRR